MCGWVCVCIFVSSSLLVLLTKHAESDKWLSCMTVGWGWGAAERARRSGWGGVVTRMSEIRGWQKGERERGERGRRKEQLSILIPQQKEEEAISQRPALTERAAQQPHAVHPHWAANRRMPLSSLTLRLRFAGFAFQNGECVSNGMIGNPCKLQGIIWYLSVHLQQDFVGKRSSLTDKVGAAVSVCRKNSAFPAWYLWASGSTMGCTTSVVLLEVLRSILERNCGYIKGEVELVVLEEQVETSSLRGSQLWIPTSTLVTTTKY